MRINRILISNILGIRKREFKPGTLTVISGGNAEGKSSLLQAVLQCFTGGHSPGLLRRGAKLGEVELDLDNGAKISVRVTTTATTYSVTDASGEEVKAPRAYIEQLGDALAVDPSKLILAKPKELAAVLLEVMPVTFTQAELQAATGENTWPIARDMTLDEASVLIKQIYEARTTANRQVKEAETTVKQLRVSLPEQDDQDWAARAIELRQTLTDSKQARESDIAGIDREKRDAIKQIEADEKAAIEKARIEARQKTEQVNAIANTVRTEKDAEYEPALLSIGKAVAEAEEKQRSHDKAQGLRNSIAIFEVNAKNARGEADHMTEALENLEELKRARLSELPIPGLEVRDGQVYSDGIPFERVNLAERTKLVFQIAAMRSGKLPFMVLDDAEKFDAETWTAFKAGALESGFQVIAARVGEGALAVETAEPQSSLALA